MSAVYFALLTAAGDVIRRRAVLEAELLALHHQVLVLQRQRDRHRVQLRAADRLFWVVLATRTHLALGKDPPESRPPRALVTVRSLPGPKSADSIAAMSGVWQREG